MNSTKHGLLFACVTVALVAILSQSCAKSSTGSGITIPSTTKIVNASLPKGLVAGNTAVVPAGSLAMRHQRDLVEDAKIKSTDRTGSFTPANQTLASAYLTNFFQQKYVGQGGSNVVGYIPMLAGNLDGAMQPFNGAPPSAHSCLAAPVQSVTMSMNAIDPMLSLTLPYLQCLQSSSPVGGGGTIFGQSGSNTSLWTTIGTDFLGSAIPSGTSINLSLGTPGGGFWNYANITNANSTTASAPETLDAVAVSYSPLMIPNSTTPTTTTSNAYAQVAISRFKAVPSAGTFELFYAATAGDITSALTSSHVFMGPGFRAISDGTHIYADGLLCNDPGMTSGGCSTNANWVSFAACMNAADISVDSTSSDCDTLSQPATSTTVGFTIATTDTLTYQELTGLNSSTIGTLTEPPTVVPQTSTVDGAIQANASVSALTPVPATF